MASLCLQFLGSIPTLPQDVWNQIVYDSSGNVRPVAYQQQSFAVYYSSLATINIQPENIGQLGFSFMWLAFGFASAATFVFAYLTVFHGKEKRKLHLAVTAAAASVAIVYYAMARAQGWTALSQDNPVNGLGPAGDLTSQASYRAFYWARYAMWIFACPLLVWSLCLVAGASVSAIFALLIVTASWVATLLLGALSKSGSRWGWFIFSGLALGLLLIGLLGPVRKRAYGRGDITGITFTYLTFFLMVTWIGYPVVWVIAEGTRSISVNAEVLLYAILDVLSKLLLGFGILVSEPVYGSYLSSSADVIDSKL
mmetsp:Transcript_4972/g.8532  ORF Transcript_4972/g.8532 Transcript_4972/m.8532 type:complete len:311 (-) Transcript_4972:598-1530(-)|eukprot:CAMPEP_0196652972 /NCGR_PEP_ID=MMETSP1086-20130531/2500_1 /TAXON_ID=77921 /ORGANISM="Cyanoptyche  gloeocystis , Strain SAG4.97" /LENGTH=310 /DNA_ID=CAMNT_0041983871 /DNA_START=44 /DNA_END=976 /DNA_ORIENTATION=+